MLFARARHRDRRGLIAVAALAESARAPLHFWLPRAMEAPTPVSAYLHSAAMVAAGVLVLGRVHPLLALGLACATIGLVGLVRVHDMLDQLHAAGLVTSPAVILVLLASFATRQDRGGERGGGRASSCS